MGVSLGWCNRVTTLRGKSIKGTTGKHEKSARKGKPIKPRVSAQPVEMLLQVRYDERCIRCAGPRKKGSFPVCPKCES